MSRCFPFPPPGYEKKPIPEDANILKKEKTREKKHKDKKDNERREGKDKKDKEKSDKKRREKKDRKEKNKDKEKQHKEKDQEKGSTSGEKRILGQSENYDGAKSHQSEKEQGKEKNESSSTLADKKQIGPKSHQSEKERGKEKKQSSSTSEDKRQIGQFGYCNGDKLHQKVERSRDKRDFSTEEKLSVQIQGHTGGDKPVQVSFSDKDSQDSKFQLEFNKKINDEEKGSGRQLVESFKGMGFKKDERTDRIADRDTCTVVEGKEKIKADQVGNKIDGHRIHHEEKSNGNAMSQNLTRSIQNKTGLSNSTDKFERRMDGKEKLKERENDDKRRDKRKSKHKDKQSQGTDKICEKEKRKEDKAKKEHKKSNKDSLRSSNNDVTVGTSNNKTPHISKDNKNAATEGSLKKRKDFEKNGFLHEHVIRPEKLPRLSPHPSSENGQELEPSKTITPFTPQKQGADKHLEVYNKDTTENGLTGQHQLPISAPQPSPVIAEASRKSLHPDMKYLSKVLSVPQVQEWSDVDDQAWLFNNRISLFSKSEVDPNGGNQGQQVWSEALRIESADVFALPYVIPY